MKVMQLFSREQVNLKRKNETRELSLKNDRLAKSLRKVLDLQKEVEFDQDKAKKVKDYQVWCADLQNKMDKALGTLKSYEKLVEEKKEEIYELVERKDELEDTLLDLREEQERLDFELNFKRELLGK